MGKHDDDTKPKLDLSATLHGVESPLTETQKRQATGFPPAKAEAGIDLGLMRDAWNDHTEAFVKLIEELLTMRKVIERNEVDNIQTRKDNGRTRLIGMAQMLTFLILGAVGYWAIGQMLTQSKETLSVAQQTGAQMVTLREQMATVSDSMSDILSLQQEHDELEALKTAAAEPDIIRAKQRRVRKKRTAVQVKVIKAQIATAPDAAARSLPRTQTLRG